jgi:hypothetical protein
MADKPNEQAASFRLVKIDFSINIHFEFSQYISFDTYINIIYLGVGKANIKSQNEYALRS